MSASIRNAVLSFNLLDAIADVNSSFLLTVIDSPIDGVASSRSPNFKLLVIVSWTLASVTIVSSAITTPAVRIS